MSRIEALEALLAKGQDTALLRYSLGSEHLNAGQHAAAVAHLERADIRAGQNTIRLSGIISYAGRALALSGAVLDNVQTQESAPRGINFFVGGSWSEPFISPTATQRLN